MAANKTETTATETTQLPEQTKPETPVQETPKAEQPAAKPARKPRVRTTAVKKPAASKAAAAKTPVARTPRRASTSAKKPVAEAIQELPAPKHISLEDPALYTNRELSWIEFDRKVLETAMDPAIPLLNRVLFLSIFFNNLDEFYMVRVMNLQKQARSGAEPTGPDKLSPAKQLSEIRRKVLEIVDQAEDLWLDQLKPALAKKDIVIAKYADLTKEQQENLNRYYDEDIFPVLTPQGVDAGRPFPMISNTSLNFVIELEEIGKEGKVRYARVKCPNNVPRFLFVSNKDSTVTPNLGVTVSEGVLILSEDLIANRLETLFPGYRVITSGLFRITRNTDGEIEEDEADDLLAAVRDYVEQRRFGSVVRLEIERGMPQRLQDFLVDHLDLIQVQIYSYSIPLGFSDFGRLMRIDRPGLKYPETHPRTPKEFEPDRNCFTEIRKKDLMVYHPYDSFNCVLEFLRQAALDPNVVAIKQTLYRCGSDSPVAKWLLEARRRGKQVTAVVELKARFDEEQNMNWAEEMERNGVNVVYGFAGLKIHAKLCFVIRREHGSLVRYAHIGSGNYNAASAKIYTDLGLFTANRAICDDIQDLFNVMTGYGRVKHYRELLVSPNTLRGKLVEHIRREVAIHKKEGNGHIIIKCNQLVDAEMMKEIYEACRAGVKVECIVRGICGLRPGVSGVSETLSVRSIVGRLLEHARVYYFHNGGKPEVYFGSADMMTRNLSGRIEVLTPILDPVLRTNVMKQIIEPQLKDNIHAWVLLSDGSYKKLSPAKGEKIYDSQEEIAKHLNLQKA